MSPLNGWVIPLWFSVFLCGGVTIYLFFKVFKGYSSFSLRLFTISLGVWTLWGFLSIQWIISPDIYEALRLSQASLGVLAVYSPLLVIFSLSFARRNYNSFLKKWKVPLSLFFLIAVIFMLSMNSSLMVKEITGTALSTKASLGLIGKNSLLFFLIALILSLLNFESMLRYAKEVHRKNIKLFVWGIMGFLYGNIVIISYGILYSSLNFYQIFFQSIVTLGLLFSFLFSLSDKRIESTEIYVGRETFQGSITMITAGGILLVLGIFSLIIPLMRKSLHLFYILSGLFVLMFILPILIAFESIKNRVSIFIERSFSKSRYDYRKEWKELSDKLSSAFDLKEILEITADVIAEVTQIESLGIFLWDEFINRFYMVESRNISASEEYFEKEDKFLDWLWRWGKPLELDSLREKEELSEYYRTYKKKFDRLGASLILPLITGRQLIGLVVLGEKTGGEPFTFEDFEILETIANQASVAITHATMSEAMAVHKQMFSLHKISSFITHDVKNAVHTLSLAVQNAQNNIHKPEFQKDLLQSISRVTERMTNLMTKLSGTSEELQLNLKPNDLNKLINEIVRKIGIQTLPFVLFTLDLGSFPLVTFDYEAIEKVLYNLIKNAIESLKSKGEIKITTKREGNYVKVMISDTGVGMTQEFIHTKLFRPFQTTKKNGLGIGLYQSKIIVDAHKGTLSVESTPGKGTTFTLRLPIDSNKTNYKR